VAQATSGAESAQGGATSTLLGHSLWSLFRLGRNPAGNDIAPRRGPAAHNHRIHRQLNVSHLASASLVYGYLGSQRKHADPSRHACRGISCGSNLSGAEGRLLARALTCATRARRCGAAPTLAWRTSFVQVRGKHRVRGFMPAGV
jgi:hypothetical protein